MNLQLDRTDQKRLEALAKREGVPAEDLVRDILHAGLAAREGATNASALLKEPPGLPKWPGVAGNPKTLRREELYKGAGE